MRKFLLFILAALFILPGQSFGCTCLAPGSFCESIIGEDNEIRPDLIVRGKFKDGGNQGNDIRVKQVLYGTVDKNDILLKYGLCDLFTNELEDGSEYIFALRASQEDYTLLGCAISFLKIENGKVIGKIAPGIDKLSYIDFLGLKSCGGDQFNVLSNLISIFPNPTPDILNIRNISTERPLIDLSINVFDIMGRIVTNDIHVEGILPEEVIPVDVSDLLPGVYIIRISDGYSEQVERIVKH